MICAQSIITSQFRHVDNSTLQQVDKQVFDNANTMKTLSDRLISARVEAGLSKAQLQRKCGLRSASTLTELESGQRIKSPQLTRIAYELAVNAMWLVEGRGPRYVGGGPVLALSITKLQINEHDRQIAECLKELLEAFMFATEEGREQMLRSARIVKKTPELSRPAAGAGGND